MPSSTLAPAFRRSLLAGDLTGTRLPADWLGMAYHIRNLTKGTDRRRHCLEDARATLARGSDSLFVEGGDEWVIVELPADNHRVGPGTPIQTGVGPID